MSWAGNLAHVREKKNVYRVLVGNTEDKWLLGTPRCRWVYNIKIDLREIRWSVMEGIHLAEERDQ
jgi:hypothetical protein